MPKSVLLIDRHAATRGMLRFALEMQGYRVVEADNLSRVADALTSGNPDLLVVGVDPADAVSGDLVKEVRWRPGLDSLPILLVGEERYAAQWDLVMIGNCAWLNKPFQMGDLPGMIESLLGAAPLPENRIDQRLPHGSGNA